MLELSGSQYGLIGDVLTDKDYNQYLKVYALSNIAWDSKSRQLYENFRNKNFEIRNLNTLFGHVITSSKAVISNDPNHDPRSKGLPDGHPVLSTFLGIPVYYGAHLVGEVGLANRKGGYDQEFLDWMEPVVSALGQIIVARWDMQARKDAEDNLLLQSKTDPLTGIFNRRQFDLNLNTQIARATRYSEDLSLMMLDIDHFKLVNDDHGHNVGDRVLTEVSNLIKSNIPEVDILARWGGEEFMVILPETNLQTGFTLAERIRKNIEEHLFSQPRHITISIGLTSLKKDDDFESFIQRVDDALYQAKDNGRNRIVVM